MKCPTIVVKVVTLRIVLEEMAFRFQASQVVLVVKNLPANAGDPRDRGSVPGSGRSPGGWHDNPLQYSCLENPMGRGAWWAMVHGVTKSWIQLKQLSVHTQIGQMLLSNSKAPL